MISTESVETTALGAAYLAGLSVGYWEDRDELLSNRTDGGRYEPLTGPEAEARRERNLAGWHDAVARARR